MSSLWTPGGEYRVPPTPPAGGGAPPPPAPPGGPSAGAPAGGGRKGAGGGDADPGGLEDLGEDERADAASFAADMAELEAQLLAAPVEEVIANHCYGLFQLAALHLGQRPPNLDEARLSIDALSAVVEGLGDRLGRAAPTLRDGLAQIRLAYVQISGAERAPGS